MNKYTIYGNPVSHSKSPQMHNAGFKLLNIDAIYNTTHLEDGEKIKQHLLEYNINGANITVPHKEIAFKKADQVFGMANKIGAVNTYINKGGKVIGYNTDAPGFLKAIEEFGIIKNGLILGAGGTAKAIAIAFQEKNIKTTILNRSKNRLKFFNNHNCDTYTWDNFPIEQQYDLVINTTTAGLQDDNLPCPQDILNQILKNSKFAIDCIYGKTTPFLKEAQNHNIPSKDGEDMLLFQGVLAFELFTGVKADKALIEAMRRGLKGESK